MIGEESKTQNLESHPKLFDRRKNRNSIMIGFGFLLISAIVGLSKDYLIIHTDINIYGLIRNFFIVSITLIVGLILVFRGFLRIALTHEKIKGFVTGLVIIVVVMSFVWFLWELGVSLFG